MLGWHETKHIIFTIGMPETEITFSIQKSREGGYEARAVGHSIFTQAESVDKLTAR
jgi:hypothetical protein